MRRPGKICRESPSARDGRKTEQTAAHAKHQAPYGAWCSFNRRICGSGENPIRLAAWEWPSPEGCRPGRSHSPLMQGRRGTDWEGCLPERRAPDDRKKIRDSGVSAASISARRPSVPSDGWAQVQQGRRASSSEQANRSHGERCSPVSRSKAAPSRTSVATDPVDGQSHAGEEVDHPVGAGARGWSPVPPGRSRSWDPVRSPDRPRRHFPAHRMYGTAVPGNRNRPEWPPGR